MQFSRMKEGSAPWGRSTVLSRLPAPVPHHLENRSDQEKSQAGGHLGMDGTRHAVVEFGVQLGKLVAEEEVVILYGTNLT